MERSLGLVVSILAAAGLTAALALPSAAQDGAADLDPAGCSNGTFVADPSAAPDLVADCQALVAVRNHWTRHSNNSDLPPDHSLLTWGRGSTVDITSWGGITVKAQRVTAIVLQGEGISGTIPPEISRLTNLESFDIWGNGIAGRIPIEFTRLPNLTWLNLASNGFIGSIPSQLSLLTRLEFLNLYGNELSGPIPVELSKLTNLKYLSLGGNELIGRIPPDLSNLTKLETLTLSRNNHTGSIPPELSQLTNLRELALEENELTGPIPPELSQLTQLRYLDLSFNQLTGPIPPQFSQLIYLIVLDLSYNQLSGPIPPELSQLEYLRSLFLVFNQNLGSIPPQFTEREDLKVTRGPFDPDLGLVVNVEEFRKLSLGNKLWEVWLCDTDGPLDLDLNSVTNLLNRTVTPYFEWLSEGRFIPQFLATGTVTLTRRELVDLPKPPPGSLSFYPLVACEDKVIRSVAHDKMKKAVIIENAAHASGLSLPHALVGSGAVMAIPGYDLTPRLITVAHEMGHILGWPHSYNGYMIAEGVFDDYDNSADIMSRGNNRDLSTGTPAINRYAAGWIDPEDVAIYSGEAATHELSPIGVDGTQMLIVPSEEGRGIFYSLSPVIAKGYNRDQPKEGVEVYFIDQGPRICDLNIHTTLPCRRTQPYPPQTAEPVRGTVHHVRGVGDTFQLGEVWVNIRERRGDRFTVAVGSGCGGYFKGTFCDDDGSIHSASIEAIADWEITRGCRGDEFCPDAVVTRSQMAAFLYRAVTHSSGEPAAAAEVVLSDVEDSAWYRPYAVWAASAGVMPAPEGVFDPDGVVTRADMAEMMAAAFGRITLPLSAQGMFSDMEGQPDRVVRAAEALRTAGVTAGCRASPLRFCPDRPITRAQMASFLYRALS